MQTITEPHGRRDDCDLCVETTHLRRCPDCGESVTTVINGHATKADHEFHATCQACQVPLVAVANAKLGG